MAYRTNFLAKATASAPLMTSNSGLVGLLL
jgi:hypothetical protein